EASHYITYKHTIYYCSCYSLPWVQGRRQPVTHGCGSDKEFELACPSRQRNGVRKRDWRRGRLPTAGIVGARKPAAQQVLGEPINVTVSYGPQVGHHGRASGRQELV